MATHTWNVKRLVELDHGGVLADQRTPNAEVLDALRRVPDAGFAVHDTPGRLADLLAERAQHQAVLVTRPPERFRYLRDAERKLDYAVKDHEAATFRLEHARHELAQLGGLSQLRRRGRHEKASVLDRIDRFQDDVRAAEGNVTRCEGNLSELRSEFAQEIAWEIQHGWRSERLTTIEAELADIPGGDRIIERRVSSPNRNNHARPDALLRRHTLEQLNIPATWEERLAEIAAPPLPGRDTGHGIDLGL